MARLSASFSPYIGGDSPVVWANVTLNQTTYNLIGNASATGNSVTFAGLIYEVFQKNNLSQWTGLAIGQNIKPSRDGYTYNGLTIRNYSDGQVYTYGASDAFPTTALGNPRWSWDSDANISIEFKWTKKQSAYLATPAWNMTSAYYQSVTVGQSVTLQWKSVANATNYVVRNGSGTVVYNGSGLSVTISSPSSASTISYYVQAESSSSAYESSSVSDAYTINWISNSTSSQTLATPTWDMGGQSSMTVPVGTSVTLKWNAVSNATGYDVRCKDDGSWGGAGTSLSRTIASPSSACTRQYTVQALNSSTSYNPSALAVFTITWTAQSSTTLSAPNWSMSGSQTTVPVNTKVTLSWYAVAAATQWEIFDENNNTIVVLNGSVTNYEVVSSTPVSHTYCLRGYTSTDASPLSVGYTVTWTASSTPKIKLAKPVLKVSPSAPAVGDKIVISWSPIANADHYNITYPNGLITTVSDYSWSIPYSYTDLGDNGGSVYYKVSATSNNSQYLESDPATVLVTYRKVDLSCTITFNPNATNASPANVQTFNYSDRMNVTIPSLAITRTGYTLLGWATSSTATVAEMTAGSIYSFPAGTTTLYAVWQESVEYIKITFDGNGGTPSSSTKWYEKGKAYGTLPTSNKSNAEFIGWFTMKSGGTQHTVNTICTGERTLYAHYQNTTPATPTWSSGSATSAKPDSTAYLAWSVASVSGVTINHYNLYVGSTLYQVSTRYFTYQTPNNFAGAVCKVQAVSTAGNVSAWSNEWYVGLDKGLAPTAPTSCYINKEKTVKTIYTNDPNNTTYDVSWTNASDPDGDLAGYRLEYRKDDQTTWTYAGSYGANVLNVQFLCSKLAGFSKVQYRVAAYDAYNQYSNYTESNQVTVSSKVPPSAPGRITVPDQAHLPVSAQDGKILATKEFRISWLPSTDADGDLAGYRIEEQANGGDWGNGSTSPATMPTYINRTVPKGTKTVRYRVQAYDALGLTSSWTYSETKNVITNTAPSTPAYIVVVDPNKGGGAHKNAVKGGEPFRIYWDPSIDAENNLEGYILQRALDGNEWETIAHPTAAEYIETVPKTNTERHDLVAYRVKAYDSMGLESNWCTSDTFNVSNNASPVVTGSWVDGTYIGSMEKGFNFAIEVHDEENDRVDVDVILVQNGAFGPDAERKLGTFEDRATPFYTIVQITDADLAKLPMTTFSIIVRARDKEGYGELTYSFTRKSTRASVTLKNPMTYPEFITGVQFTRLYGQFPSDCIMKVEVTNNANDQPHLVKWEDCTTEARSYEEYQFKNRLAWTPAFNFRITLSRGASGASGYIKRISGHFITAGDIIAF